MNVGKPVRLEQAVDEQIDLTQCQEMFLEPSFLAQVGYDMFGSDHLELTPSHDTVRSINSTNWVCAENIFRD